MISTSVRCEKIVGGLTEPISIQLDEEHQVIFALTGWCLTRVDLTKSTDNSQIVLQRKQNLQEEDEEDEYSQGESDNEIERVSDPFEDSEPSTDDDEERIANRRNWRRYGWRTYRLDNPCSILFLSHENQLIVLNEGVISFMTIGMSDGRPFVQSPSKNIFCYDYPVFSERSIQPWSIAPTATTGLFVLSLLNSSQLYSLDTSGAKPVFEKFITTPIHTCATLRFHPPSNSIFIYDNTQLLVLSLATKTVIKIDFPKLNNEDNLRAVVIDQMGFIYLHVGSAIFKCTWTSSLQPIERLDIVDKVVGDSNLAVTSAGNVIYLSDMEGDCIYRCQKAPTSTE